MKNLSRTRRLLTNMNLMSYLRYIDWDMWERCRDSLGEDLTDAVVKKIRELESLTEISHIVMPPERS